MHTQIQSYMYVCFQSAWRPSRASLAGQAAVHTKQGGAQCGGAGNRAHAVQLSPLRGRDAGVVRDDYYEVLSRTRFAQWRVCGLAGARSVSCVLTPAHQPRLSSNWHITMLIEPAIDCKSTPA